jgi:single-strand DNA-binding protein
MNKITILGRVGKDPEIKTFEWGKVAHFTIATDESYKNKSGEKVEQTEWHNVSAKLAMAEFAGKYLKKGNRVLVEGSLRSREYEKEGVRMRFYEIITTRITPIDWPEMSVSDQVSEQVPVDAPFDDLPF